jgi:hypothetical protein
MNSNPHKEIVMSDEYPNQQQNYPGLANAKEYAAFARSGQLSAAAVGYASDVTRPPGLLSESAQRMAQLGSLLEGALEELTAVNMRLFGPRPQSASGVNQPKAGIGGQAGDVLGALEILVDRAQAVREEARGLNARI